MAEGGGLPPPVLSSRAETAKRVAAAARRKEEEAALLKAAEEAAARVGISPSQPLDARRSALTQRLEPLAPRGDAMRWLSQLEDQGASELISPRSRPHSPMASEHASGVAVDGEQIVAPVARRPAPEQPRNWSDMLWYSIAGIDPVTGERASDRARDYHAHRESSDPGNVAHLHVRVRACLGPRRVDVCGACVLSVSNGKAEQRLPATLCTEQHSKAVVTVVLICIFAVP